MHLYSHSLELLTQFASAVYVLVIAITWRRFVIPKVSLEIDKLAAKRIATKDLMHSKCGM